MGLMVSNHGEWAQVWASGPTEFDAPGAATVSVRWGNDGGAAFKITQDGAFTTLYRYCPVSKGCLVGYLDCLALPPTHFNQSATSQPLGHRSGCTI